MPLNDFYRITVIDKKQCEVEEIQTVDRPPSRFGHGMLALENKYIVVLGG